MKYPRYETTHAAASYTMCRGKSHHVPWAIPPNMSPWACIVHSNTSNHKG